MSQGYSTKVGVRGGATRRQLRGGGEPDRLMILLFSPVALAPVQQPCWCCTRAREKRRRKALRRSTTSYARVYTLYTWMLHSPLSASSILQSLCSGPTPTTIRKSRCKLLALKLHGAAHFTRFYFFCLHAF